MNQHWYIAEISFLARDCPEAVGDFDLICIRRISSGGAEDGEIAIEDRTLEIQMAPLHLHQIARSRSVMLPYQRLETMLSLEYDGEPEGALFLAPLTRLFAQPPVWMAGKELGMVQVIQERQNGRMYTAHVSPVTPHIGGLITRMSLWCETIEQLLPIRQAPLKAHCCRQQGRYSACAMEAGNKTIR